MSPRRRKGPGTPFAVAIVLLVLVIASGGAFLLVLRDRDSSTTSPSDQTTTSAATTTTGTATAPAEQTSFRVYYVHTAVLGPVRRNVPRTTAVARASLAALFAQPSAEETSAGYSSAIPADAKLGDVTLGTDGVLDVAATGNLPPLALAQIVFTATQFPTVKRVRINDGNVLTRASFESLSPIILVESPLPGDTVTSPLRVSGTSDTFEATLQLELTDTNGKVLAKRFLTATSGSGTRGTFSGALRFTADAGTGLVLRAYEDSAENGQRIHITEVPLVAG
jgi:hypothetical protein